MAAIKKAALEKEMMGVKEVLNFVVIAIIRRTPPPRVKKSAIVFRVRGKGVSKIGAIANHEIIAPAVMAPTLKLRVGVEINNLLSFIGEIGSEALGAIVTLIKNRVE